MPHPPPPIVLPLTMPPKRSHLQSPNPVKQQMVAPEDLVVDEAVAEVELIVQVAENMEAQDVADAAAAEEQLSTALPVTPPRNAGPASRVLTTTPPASPATNRTRYLEGRQPARVCCNLDLIRAAAPGGRITISAICVAVFPASSNPERRYIQLADPYGSTGLTVWNSNVCKFGFSSVGKLVTAQKLVVSTHNGNRCLTMARDSGIEIDDDGKHAVVDWWESLLHQPILNALEAHNAPENTMISVSGVVGSVSEETKMVGGVARVLTTVNLVDATGKFDVRTWNHIHNQFGAYIDKPIVIKRVRVTSFAGTKLAELLDGNGSEIDTTFVGSANLLAWWSSEQ